MEIFFMLSNMAAIIKMCKSHVASKYLSDQETEF